MAVKAFGTMLIRHIQPISLILHLVHHGMQGFESTICAGYLANLTELYLQGSFTSCEGTNDTGLISFMEGVSDHCKQIEVLHLCNKHLSVPAVKAICKVLNRQINITFNMVNLNETS